MYPQAGPKPWDASQGYTAEEQEFFGSDPATILDRVTIDGWVELGRSNALLRGMRDGRPMDLRSVVTLLVELLATQETAILELRAELQKGKATT